MTAWTFRVASTSIVSPFEYSSLPFALILGYLLWGDWPDLISFLGSGLIIFSGLLIVYIERRSSKHSLLAVPVKDY